MRYIIFLWVSFNLSFVLWAQDQHLHTLDTIYLSDENLQKFSTGQKQQKLKGASISQHSYALTDLLQNNTTIYFKQNGYGMVSSPAFRGTTASQTAVVWNGININSNLTGQTDFNTLITANFSSIDIKYGGGSVLYGTGAIGGSVHLNQRLLEEKEQTHQIQFGYGSFNTAEARYSYQNTLNKYKVRLAYARRQSDNDYDIPKQNRKNLNGQFDINSIDAMMSHTLSKNDELRFYSNFTFGERHFSLLRASDPRTKYRNVDTRNMIEWRNRQNKFQSKLKLAYLTEDFTFYDNLDRNTSSSSDVGTQWLQYESSYESNSLKLNAIINYQNAKAEGNQITDAQRQIGGVSLLFYHQISKRINYQASVRQDINEDFENPLLFSFGTNFRLNNYWTFRWHASKNYRLPTFNDLYWNEAGNPNLHPEEAYQTEIATTWRHRDFKISTAAFYNDITDMIRWLPDTNGVWRPQNTDEVITYGLETDLNYSYTLRDLSTFNLSLNYAYTRSENQATGNQLIYVPYHIANTQLAYQRDRWSIQWFWSITGEVFTRSDNDPQEKIDPFQLLEVQLSYKMPKLYCSSLSLRVQNLLDTQYQVVENRPMPGMAITLNLLTTIKP